MALNKSIFKKEVYDGFYKIFTNQAKKATSGDEQEDPDVVIKQIANDMAEVVTDAVDTYVKSGDIAVGPTNFTVISSAPGSAAAVTPTTPAKMK